MGRLSTIGSPDTLPTQMLAFESRVGCGTDRVTVVDSLPNWPGDRELAL